MCRAVDDGFRGRRTLCTWLEVDLSKAGGSEATGQSIFGTCSGVIRPLTEVRRSPSVILINIIAATAFLSKELKKEVGRAVRER